MLSHIGSYRSENCSGAYEIITKLKESRTMFVNWPLMINVYCQANEHVCVSPFLMLKFVYTTVKSVISPQIDESSV